MKIRLSEHFTYRILLRFVAPSVIMMVISSVYGIVDGFFVSNHVGKTAFASVNFIMPVIMILGGLGFIIGTGGSALVAKTMGEGKKEEANRIFTMLICATVIGGVVLSAAGVLFVRPLALLIGATPEILEDCVVYARFIFLGNTAFMLQNVFQSFLIAAERPKMGLVISISAGVTNMLLDFLLIGVFHGGLIAAAIATDVGTVVGGGIPLLYFASKRNKSPLRFCRFRFELRPLLKTFSNGVSEFVTNISVSIVGMLYNRQLLRYAGEDGLSAYGVLMYVNFIFIGVFFGYSTGVSPVVSYHLGANNKEELRGLFKKSIFLIALSGTVMTALSVGLAYPLSLIFVSYDAALLDLTTHAMRLYASCFLLFGFNVFASAFFTALNDGLRSAVISLSRTFVFQIPAVLLLPLLLGADGIWLSVAAAEAVTLFLSLGLLIRNRGKYGFGKRAQIAFEE